MAVTRHQENLNDKGQKVIHTGQQNLTLNEAHLINETRDLNINHSYAYIDQSRIEPALKDRMPSIGGK